MVLQSLGGGGGEGRKSEECSHIVRKIVLPFTEHCHVTPVNELIGYVWLMDKVEFKVM